MIESSDFNTVDPDTTYLAGILFGIAGLFFRFSVYSIFTCLAIFLVFRLQIWREEKELVERFGEGFIEYRKNVPALLVRPSKISAFLRFLRSGFSSSTVD